MTTKIKIIQLEPAPEFVSTPYMSAGEKSKAFMAFIRFIETGCQPEKFTKVLYKHLYLMFSHIAHSDHGGFTDVWFSDPIRRLKWINHVLTVNLYGDPTHTSYDIEINLRRWLLQNPQLILKFQTDASLWSNNQQIELGRQLLTRANETVKAEFRKLVLADNCGRIDSFGHACNCGEPSNNE